MVQLRRDSFSSVNAIVAISLARQARVVCVVLVCLAGATACGRKVATAELSAPSYERGFQAFPSPRTFDAPGTVFRVDRDGVRRPVADLSGMLRLSPLEEAVPRVVVRSQVDGSAFMRWLGGESRALTAQKIDSAYLAIFGARREFAYEVDLKRVVDSAARVVDWTKDGTVFLITETIAADSVEIGFLSQRSFSFSDSTQSVRAGAGAAVLWKPVSSTQLSVKFLVPHRVLYKADQLVRRSPLEGTIAPTVIRMPSREFWRWQTPPDARSTTHESGPTGSRP